MLHLSFKSNYRLDMKDNFLIHTLHCLICTLMLASGLQAATISEEAVVTLSLSDGLAGETVHTVMTDHSGLTWIATNSGVNAYNGKQMHTFRITDVQGRLLTVSDLCETDSHSIWAATEGGLYRMTYGEDHFEHLLPEVKQAVTLLAVGDTVYIGGEQGLQVFDGHQLKHQDIDVSRHGLDNIVRQYVKGDDGKIWFLGRFELNCYDPQSGTVSRHPLNMPSEKVTLTRFARLADGRFVVGTRGQGLFVCDIQAGTAEHVEGVGNIVSSVQHSSNGCICVATDGAGACLLEVRGERLEVRERFDTEGDNRHRLPSNGTYCYYRDKNGVNWFGFVRYGLAYTYQSGDLFSVFKTGGFTSEGLNIRTFCRHGDDVVLGTQDGFYYVNTADGTHCFFSSKDLGGGHIVNAIAWYEGCFYIGTFDGGLRIFDPHTLSLRNQTITPLLDDVSIGDLQTGPDGRLWIGCGHGLVIIRDGKVDQHFTEQNSRIVGGLIISITFDATGNA